MNKSIIILILVLSVSLNIYSSFGRQWEEDSKKEAVADDNKPKLVKVLQPWTEERIKLIQEYPRHPPGVTVMALSP